MDTDVIKIRGAKENNLKNVDVDIQKGKITAVTGVSGSGKSSLVFNIIAVEAMRQLQETFPIYVRNKMPFYREPKIDAIENITPTIVVNQRKISGDIRSTVGTMTDISTMLRLLFSRFSSKKTDSSSAFSFNDPAGMCLECKGIGKTIQFDMEKVLDMEKSLNEGAINVPGFQINSYQWQMYANSGLFDNDKPLKEYTAREWNELLHGRGRIVDINNNTGKIWGESYKLTYEGLQDRLDRLYLKKAGKTQKKAAEKIINQFTCQRVCKTCSGKRLNKEALESRILGYNIGELGQMEIAELKSILETNPNKECENLMRKIISGLDAICNIGLGYLSLDRVSNTLSGGEIQRLKIVRALGCNLTGMTYILDEPSTGLHPKDIGKINKLLLQLKKKGNTVIVVEHDKEVIKIADDIIEMGPGAGDKGGEVVFHGSLRQANKRNSSKGKVLYEPNEIKKNLRRAKGWIRLTNCKTNNLKGFDLNIPKGMLVAVTGVSGSGKSSLVFGEVLQQSSDVIEINKKPLLGNNRSNPASYLGIFGEIRKIFSKASGENIGLFSFNSKGACPACGGKGTIETEMAFMEPVITVCESCNGTRYNSKALSYKYKGMNIAEAMELTVSEAMNVFKNTKIQDKLQIMNAIGLDYITLGQPVSTLSGGECQRLKLAAHLKSKNGIYVIDEPSSGLHEKDIEQLLELFYKIVDNGNTIIFTEHNLKLVGQADWIIDMGPEGGKKGGQILFSGRILDLIKSTDSDTAEYLRRNIEGGMEAEKNE